MDVDPGNTGAVSPETSWRCCETTLLSEGRMHSPFTDTTYLAYQYDDSEKLRIRGETHRLYTEGDDDFTEAELRHIAPRARLRALDVGCGHGRLASALRERGVRYVGLDRSRGMVREANIASPGAFLQADATT